MHGTREFHVGMAFAVGLAAFALGACEDDPIDRQGTERHVLRNAKRMVGEGPTIRFSCVVSSA